jgi:hypothetical protein
MSRKQALHPSCTCTQAEKQSWPEALPPPLDGLQQPGEALARTVTTWQQRTAAYARGSFLSAYAAFIDNTLVAALQAVRADELFRRLTPWLEDRLAWLSRALLCDLPWHQAASAACMRLAGGPPGLAVTCAQQCASSLGIIWATSAGCMSPAACRVSGAAVSG